MFRVCAVDSSWCITKTPTSSHEWLLGTTKCGIQSHGHDSVALHNHLVAIGTHRTGDVTGFASAFFSQVRKVVKIVDIDIDIDIDIIIIIIIIIIIMITGEIR